MTEETAIVRHEAPQTYFVATNSEEMAKAQHGLTEWVRLKVKSCQQEIRELTGAINIAKERKWASKALLTQKNRAFGRRIYYEKMLAALEAGYVMIPEFEVQSFAIRVTRDSPGGYDRTTGYRMPTSPDQKPDVKPVGEGEYVSPTAIDRTGEYLITSGDSKGSTMKWARADEFQDVAFPVKAAKLEVMNATAQAMALKIFDSVGMAPNFRAKGDPVIVGEILGPKVGYTQKKCRFLISWHINVEDL